MVSSKANIFQDTAIGKLPIEWDVKLIGEVCNILDSKRVPLNKENRDKIKGDIPYYGANGIVDYINDYLFDESLILMAEDGGYFSQYKDRHIAYKIEGKSWVNNHAHVLQPKVSKSLDWIYYCLVHKNILPFINGGTRAKLNQADLRQIPIQFPPLAEQQKIASILSSVDEAIDKTKAIIQQTEEVKKGLMQELFSRGFGHKEFVKTHVGSIPASWKVVVLSNCSEIKSGVTKGRKLSNKETFPVPYLRVANVQDGYLDLSEIKYIDVTQEEMERYALEEDDILLTEGGDADKLGRGYIWHGEIPNCIHQNHVFRVRVDSTMIIPEYLAFLVGSDYGKSYFMQCAKQTTNLASINSTQLKAFPVLLPPQNEQIEIVKILNSVNKKIKKEQETLVNLQTLKKVLCNRSSQGKSE
ncbi:restriction endonuclease subunit S [Bacillus cereus]